MMNRSEFANRVASQPGAFSVDDCNAAIFWLVGEEGVHEIYSRFTDATRARLKANRIRIHLEYRSRE
jgi:hypothetical protein